MLRLSNGKTEMEPMKFCIANEAMKKEPLHYTDCGLDNIFLMNGYDYHEVDEDRYLSVSDIDGLHKAIGLHIVLYKKAPTPQEMRFLRTEMHLSQADLASKLGVTDQSIARWEKGHCEVPGPAVFSFKVLYVFSLIPEERRDKIMETFLDELDRLQAADDVTDQFVLSYENDKWLEAPLVCLVQAPNLPHD